MKPSELIRRARAHLNEVGLKKGSPSHAYHSSFPNDESPVCGIGALKWVVTGSPHRQVTKANPVHREFVLAWTCMNKAAVDEDPSIPYSDESFMVYNDDDDTTKIDVLLVMDKAAQLAEERETS